MKTVVTYLQEYGPQLRADIDLHCGGALKAEGPMALLEAQGIVRKRDDLRWEIVKARATRNVESAPGLPPAPARYRRAVEQRMQAEAQRALEPVPPQRRPALQAVPVDPPALADPENLENALGALKAAVARTIETQIGELIARPADLSLLAGMLKQLSRRVP